MRNPVFEEGREKHSMMIVQCQSPTEGNDLELTAALCVIGDFVPIILAFRCRLRESG